MNNKRFAKKKNNKFHYHALVNVRQLKNYAEKRFCNIVRLYVDETLEPDPKCFDYGPEEVRAGLIALTKTFQEDYYRYVSAENTDNYWNFEIDGTKVNMFRTDDDQHIAYVTVSIHEESEFLVAIKKLLSTLNFI